MMSTRQSDKVAEFLANLASDFTALLSLPELTNRTLQALDRELGLDCCVIGLLEDRRPGVLTFVAASGPGRDSCGVMVSRGDGLPWSVLETGLSVYVPDLQIEPPRFRWNLRLRSGIYAPLIVEGRRIGVLSAHRRQVNAFSAAELDLLTNVAGYVAGACEVALLCERHRVLATTDPLTGLMNRRAFLDDFHREMNRSRRTGRPFVVALVDLDRFKTINDIHGHTTGDKALVRVAEALRRRTRSCDRVVRWGGDEFVVLLPSVATAQAHNIMERVGSIEMQLDDTDGAMRLTISWGIASWPMDGDSLDSLIDVADIQLFATKRLKQASGISTVIRQAAAPQDKELSLTLAGASGRDQS